jgi:hypothetical protein
LEEHQPSRKRVHEFNIYSFNRESGERGGGEGRREGQEEREKRGRGRGREGRARERERRGKREERRRVADSPQDSSLHFFSDLSSLTSNHSISPSFCSLHLIVSLQDLQTEI